MPQQYFEHLAFISYSHADKKVAEYIHKKLSEYHVPQIITADFPELDGTEFNIFRDSNFTGGGMLWKNIAYKIEASKYLIIICSPNSATSNEEGEHWVNREVEHFINLGKPERVIPVIIDGRVDTDDEKLQCYCPILKKGYNGDEFYGIDGTKIDKEKPFETARTIEEDVLDHIKAALLGLGYDSYKKYAHSVKYYKDYVDRNGILYGLHELDESTIAKKSDHYKFSYKEGVLERVSFENSYGKVISHNDLDEQNRVIDSTFIYDSSGNLIKTENRNEKGKIVRVQKYEKDYKTINFLDEKSESMRLSSHLSVSGNLHGSDEKADIKSVHLERDEKGQIIKRTYHKHHNEYSPVSDADGIYGLEYELDDNGRVTAELYLNLLEQRTSTKKGVAGKLFVYDEGDNRINVIFVDKDKNPIMTESKYAVEKDFYDEVGNRISEEYFDANNKPVIRDRGFFKFERRFDQCGNELERRYYDIDNNITFNSDGYRIRRCKYDVNGNPVQTSFYKDEENLMSGSNGIAIVRRKFNAKGNGIEYSYYGVKEEPVISKDGFHKVTYVLDDFGNALETRNYNVNNNLTVGIGDDDYAKKVRKYDSRGNCIETSYYRDEDNLMLNSDGIAIIRSKFDDKGNCTEYSYYGVNEEPVISKDGYHKVIYVCDDFGNALETRNYDVNNNLVVGIGDYEYAKLVSKYDSRGNCIERSYYRDEDNLMSCSDGIAIIRSKFDEKGNCTEYSYYGVKEEPVISKYGFHKVTYVYDDVGNKLEVRNYDVNNNLVVGIGDYEYAKLVKKYDSRGNCIEQIRYKKEENLMSGSDGTAIIRSKFDDKGNSTEYSYYGVKEEPVISKDGFHKVTYVLDDFGNELETRNYDVNNNLVVGIGDYEYAKLVKKYDSRGNCIERTFYKDEERLMLPSIVGTARICIKYDERNNPVDFKYFGEKDELVLSKYGCHHKVNKFDIYRNRIEESCYDQNENFIVCEFEADAYDDAIPRKYARRTAKYDSFQNCIEECFYKDDIHLMIGLEGFSKVTKKYNLQGTLLEEEYFGTNDEPVNCSKGYHKIIYKYDEYGNYLGQEFVKMKQSIRDKILKFLRSL